MVILSLVLLICALFHKIIPSDDKNYNTHASEIEEFLSGTTSSSYTSILILTDTNITLLNNTVMDICGVPLQRITENDLNKYDIFGSFGLYIRVEKLSFEEPYFEYKFINIMVCILFYYHYIFDF